MENILICTHDQQLIPQRKSTEALGRDIKSAETITIEPGEVKRIKSGIKTYIPMGRCCKMYARSSLPIKNNLILANSVGLVYSSYRGEYRMQMYNISKEPVTIEAYTRLCQIEFSPHHRGENNFGTPEIPNITIEVNPEKFENFENYYPSERGSGGFGSTGKQ